MLLNDQCKSDALLQLRMVIAKENEVHCLYNVFFILCMLVSSKLMRDVEAMGEFPFVAPSMVDNVETIN